MEWSGVACDVLCGLWDSVEGLWCGVYIPLVNNEPIKMLQANGTITDHEKVVSLKCCTIGIMKGFKSTTIRIHSIEYNNPTTHGPNSVVFKSKRGNHELDWVWWGNEVQFYTMLAPSVVSIPVIPTLYYAHIL